MREKGARKREHRMRQCHDKCVPLENRDAALKTQWQLTERALLNFFTRLSTSKRCHALRNAGKKEPHKAL